MGTAALPKGQGEGGLGRWRVYLTLGTANVSGGVA